MNESKQQATGSDAPDAEVELSADDLLQLAGPCDNNNRPEEASPRTKVVATMASEPVAQQSAPKPGPRRISFPNVAVSLMFGVASVSATYYFMTKLGYATGSTEQEQAAQLPAASPKGNGKPVLFANPFDAKEVFEFPAGTSEAEARDAVAEILMDRAMQRQRKFDARVSNNR